MDVWFDLALMAHLLALMAAGATLVAMPLISRRMAGASAEMRLTLGGLAKQIGRSSQIAFGVLLISGSIMLWLRFGGLEGASPWFWAKMALIVVAAIGMGVGGRFRGKAQGGNKAAAAIAGVAAWVTRLSVLGVVIAAVLAFN